MSSDFERKSTVIHLRGAGEEGLGEDVTYDAVDHEILQAAGPALPLAGQLHGRLLLRAPGGLELFPEPPQREVSQRYRTWAYESAALDLALRQAGTTLHEALGRPPRAGALRRVAAPRRAAHAGAAARAPGASTRGCASSSTRRAPGTSG